ncbi:MAG: hypothetical protein JRK53_14025 [Deltaproteobacteria bacterium]|nr:hypothetical protein [Deltaproteobacteria bacterium]
MPHRQAPTLCFPDRHKSCFACCPPIRPAAYEHIQHQNIIQRELRDNTRAFAARGPAVAPIRGFSCWALGYLDRRRRLVGCLLHPAQNDARDLRYRVDYGEKCRRESCPASKTFLRLDERGRRYWLGLANGLDAFAYSSRVHNPLFGLLGWGPDVLRGVFREADRPILCREAFFREFPFFSTRSDPAAHAYLLRGIAERSGYAIFRSGRFRQVFEEFAEQVVGESRRMSNTAPGGVFTHRLSMDEYFLDFARLSVGLRRTDPKHAEFLKRIVDRAIEKFNSGFRI